MRNIPYKKIYSDDVNRILLNPITKDKPYLTMFQTAAQIRKSEKRVSNNKKGIRLALINLGSSVEKYYVKYQLIPIKGSRYFKRILHYAPKK